MAESTVKITFEIDGLQQSVTSIDDAKAALNDLETQAKKTEKATEDVGDSLEDAGKKGKEAGETTEGAMKVADEATGGLATKVKEVGKGLLTMGKTGYASLLKLAGGSRIFAAALAATGIGLLVVAIGAIASQWDNIVGLVSGVDKEQKQLLADTQDTATAQQDALDAISASENSLKLSGKTEKEIRDLKIQQTNETITALEAQLTQQKEVKKAQVEAAERNKNILQGILMFISAPITLILATIDKISSWVGEGTNLVDDIFGSVASMVFDPEEVAEEGDATLVETEKQLAKLKNSRDGYLLQNQKDASDASKKAEEDAQKAADAEKKRLEDLEALKKSIREAEANQESEQRQKALEDLDTYYNDLITKATEAGINTAELEASQLEARDALKEKYAQEDIARAKAVTDAEKKAAEDAAAILDARLSAQLGFASALGGAIGALGGLFEEGTAAAKAAALAEIAIGTGVGFINALDIAQKSSKATGPGAAFAFPIFYATQIAAVLAAAGKAKSILATTKGGGSGASVSAPSIPSAPSYDPTAALQGISGTQTGENQITLGQQQGSTGATIVKAYVVSSDMSKQQEADKKINDLARL